MSKKRVLITGSAGFIGTHFVDHVLKNTDWDIVGIDSFRHRGDSLRITQDPERYKILTHDLTTPISDRMIHKIGPIDYVVNMASESHVDRSITDPVDFIDNNIKLVVNMLEYARKAKPEFFIQISTDEVYGAALEGVNHKEWDVMLPSNPYCLHPDSQVLTDSGYKRIEDVNILSDFVFGHKKVGRHCTKYQPVNKYKYKHKGKMFKIKTRTQEIICTGEHRLFYRETFFSNSKSFKLGNNTMTKRPHVRTTEIKAKDLKVNDKLLAIKSIQSIQKKEINNDFSRFLGYFLGDGSYSERSKYVRLADQKKEYLEFYKKIMMNFLGASKKSSTGEFGTIYKHGSKDCWYLQFASEGLRNIINLKEKEKIAQYFFDAKDENVFNFLAGFFDADAHYRYEDDKLISVRVYQSIKQTLIDVKALLTKIGVVSSIDIEKSKLNGKERIGYILKITEASSLKEMLKIPTFKNKEGTITRKPQRTNCRSKNSKWDQVVSIEEIDYDGFIYDLEMPCGNYVADGLLVHNSGSKAAQESLAISYWRTYGVPVVITNTMNNFAELQDSEKFVPMLISRINKGETVTIHGEEGNIGSRYYLHARNHADAILFILQKTTPTMYYDNIVETIMPDKYNVVGEVELNNLEMAQKIAEILGKELKYRLVAFHNARPGHDRRYALDGAKLKNMGWTAPVDFESSLRNTVEWTLAHPEWLV